MTDIKHCVTAAQYAKQMKLSVRRINALCNQGRIPGALQLDGRLWLIPKTAPIAPPKAT